MQTYWKNWGPRVGLAYSIDSKTVIRAGYAQVFTQAGGVGGRGGAFNGTGQTGFNISAIGPTERNRRGGAGPSYWLNNSAYLGQPGQYVAVWPWIYLSRSIRPRAWRLRR